MGIADAKGWPTRPEVDWSAIGLAVRITLAAYVYLKPADAASKGLTQKNFMERANERIANYVDWFYSMPTSSSIDGGASPKAIMRRNLEEDMARACALGNPSACGGLGWIYNPQ